MGPGEGTTWPEIGPPHSLWAGQAADHELGNCPFVLAFVEVDGLERAIDGDGRADGGTALQALVRTTWSTLGRHDPVVRWGPAEFLCGLVGSSEKEAERRFAIVDQVLRYAVGTRISVGLAQLVAGETPPELLACAEI